MERNPVLTAEQVPAHLRANVLGVAEDGDVREDGSLGVNVWWTIGEGSVELERAKEVLVAHGFEATDVRTPTYKTAFCRAMQVHANGRAGFAVKRIGEDAGNLIIGVTYTGVDHENNQLDPAQVVKAAFNKADESVTAVVDYANASEYIVGLLDAKRGEWQAIVDAIPGDYERYKHLVTELDLRAFVRNVMVECSALPKRPTGGIYFVPNRWVERVRAAKRVVGPEKFGGLGMGTLYVERVYNGEEERKNVWESCVTEIQKVVDETMERVSKIEKRAGFLTKHEAQLAELEKMTSIYAGILGEEANAEDVLDTLREAESEIARKMDEVRVRAEEAREKAKAEAEVEAEAEEKATSDAKGGKKAVA